MESTWYVFIKFKFNISENSFTKYILLNDFSIPSKSTFFVFST